MVILLSGSAPCKRALVHNGAELRSCALPSRPVLSPRHSLTVPPTGGRELFPVSREGRTGPLAARVGRQAMAMVLDPHSARGRQCHTPSTRLRSWRTLSGPPSPTTPDPPASSGMDSPDEAFLRRESGDASWPPVHCVCPGRACRGRLFRPCPNADADPMADAHPDARSHTDSDAYADSRSYSHAGANPNGDARSRIDGRRDRSIEQTVDIRRYQRALLGLPRSSHRHR